MPSSCLEWLTVATNNYRSKTRILLPSRPSTWCAWGFMYALANKITAVVCMYMDFIYIYTFFLLSLDTTLWSTRTSIQSWSKSTGLLYILPLVGDTFFLFPPSQFARSGCGPDAKYDGRYCGGASSLSPGQNTFLSLTSCEIYLHLHE